LNKLDDDISIQGLSSSLYRSISKYRGREDTQIKIDERDVKLSNIKLIDIGNEVNQLKIRLKYEENKNISSFSEHKKQIEKYSEDISHFIRYLIKKNKLFDRYGVIKYSGLKEDRSYIKIVGEVVASSMGNKIIYQGNTIIVDSIDYLSEFPYFLTSENKRIAFGDLSGGQGTANYLRAKLDINERRKYIVLLDELSNMDNRSYEIVLDRLRELNNNNKLLIAILVKPLPEDNVFRIKIID